MKVYLFDGAVFYFCCYYYCFKLNKSNIFEKNDNKKNKNHTEEIVDIHP